MKARGLCIDHYDALRRYGDPLTPRSRRGDPDFNFWAKVDMDGPIPAHRPELGQCWVWTKGTNRKGYGMFAAGKQRSIGAHRWIWLRTNGPIPDGLVIDHLCRNRSCVRVSHMEPVTNGENSLRGETFAAANLAKTHCKWGHPLTPDNVYVSLRWPTRRQCKTCTRNRARGLHQTGQPVMKESP